MFWISGNGENETICIKNQGEETYFSDKVKKEKKSESDPSIIGDQFLRLRIFTQTKNEEEKKNFFMQRQKKKLKQRLFTFFNLFFISLFRRTANGVLVKAM